ncbi:MAG: hypothetical protein IT537_00975 [Hyphomicrobiales bacterium]|nr:hypothetical protein [Hyphomicrobiales bacterium]
MKMLVTSVAVAAMLATPALAQTRRAHPGVQPVRPQVEVRPLTAPNAVYEGNQYLGSDPDPNVRLMLRLDAEHRDF